MWLPQFFIARYPVTVGQWRAYCRATGAAVDTRSVRGEANHPVVHVSWEDAVGYCAWLTGMLPGRARAEAAGSAGLRTVPDVLATLLLKGDGGSGPWAVMLPSEVEWERAARGATGRRYPYGDRIDGNLANYWGEHFGDPIGLLEVSAVGCFAGGRTPDDGVEDLAGNVWEWTRSEFRPYEYDRTDGRESMDASSASRRVVRGGWFFFNRELVDAAARNIYEPFYRLNSLGFRVVLSPFRI